MQPAYSTLKDAPGRGFDVASQFFFEKVEAKGYNHSTLDCLFKSLVDKNELTGKLVDIQLLSKPFGPRLVESAAYRNLVIDHHKHFFPSHDSFLFNYGLSNKPSLASFLKSQGEYYMWGLAQKVMGQSLINRESLEIKLSGDREVIFEFVAYSNPEKYFEFRARTDELPMYFQLLNKVVPPEARTSPVGSHVIPEGVDLQPFAQQLIATYSLYCGIAKK